MKNNADAEPFVYVKGNVLLSIHFNGMYSWVNYNDFTLIDVKRPTTGNFRHGIILNSTHILLSHSDGHIASINEKSEIKWQIDVSYYLPKTAIIQDKIWWVHFAAS